MTDEELVASVQKGDIESFGEIVKRMERPLFRYIKNLINQVDEEVEDVLQEVFISAYINIQDFDLTKKFSSWIYRIAHNKSVDYFKKKKPKKITTEESDNLVWKEKVMEEMEIEREEKERVKMCIDRMDLKYREVMLLHYFEDKNYEEISEILKTSTNNVRVMIFRAKNLLKRSLEKEYAK